ncbi:hypothetical protein [Brasilonema bromeliae]|uniref:Uncharacterized protein n=1 Tax=Brasilonema bromeliae SPC951 TaxID=385972 RepID=A0ABX1PDK0_9CYAN|nr:hypothetical protein [Brasilonema bromeliae]NMG22530.1 hypothetical protein [Brasilonema bromeliae SPC951]
MKIDTPQPPRPTIDQVNAAYREGLFACGIRTSYELYLVRLGGQPIPMRGVTWIPGNRSMWSQTPQGWEPFDWDESAPSWFKSDSLVFPFGRVPVAEWRGWPHYNWQEIASLVQWPGNSGNFIPFREWKVEHVFLGTFGEFDSAKRLNLAGLWSIERCIAFPDEAPFARAAWSDPVNYLLYADHVDSQGCSLTAMALRRVAELTAKEAEVKA